MSAICVHTLYTIGQILFGYELIAMLNREWPQLWSVVAVPLLIPLRFSLYSFFTMLIIKPLSQDINQFGHLYLKNFSKHNRNIAIIFLGVMAVVASLIASGQSLKIVSVIIGVISILIAIAYTSIAYRLFVLLTTMSRKGLDCLQSNKYDDIASTESMGKIPKIHAPQNQSGRSALAREIY